MYSEKKIYIITSNNSSNNTSNNSSNNTSNNTSNNNSNTSNNIPIKIIEKDFGYYISKKRKYID